MEYKSIIQYFYKGFSLANQNLEILFIGLLLSSPSLLNVYVQNTFVGKAITSVWFIFAFISLGFTLSIPIFLVHKQQKKILSYKEVFKVVMRNTKRIIIPAILLFLLLCVLFVITLILLAMILHPTRSQAMTFLQDLPTLNKGWHAIFLIPIVVLSFFEFTSFFFSLEDNNLFISMKKNLVVSFKNLTYITLVILFGVVVYSINSFIPIGTSWVYPLRFILGLYINLVLIASSLLYYQHIIKKDKE